MNHLWPKSRLAALLLCFFLGWLGVHRFYVGKVGTGLLMLCTLGFFGIWTTIDCILIACGIFRDIEGRPLVTWLESAELERDPVAELQSRLEQVDREMGRLQERTLEVNEKFDRRQYGHLF